MTALRTAWRAFLALVLSAAVAAGGIAAVPAEAAAAGPHRVVIAGVPVVLCDQAGTPSDDGSAPLKAPAHGQCCALCTVFAAAMLPPALPVVATSATPMPAPRPPVGTAGAVLAAWHTPRQSQGPPPTA